MDASLALPDLPAPPADPRTAFATARRTDGATAARPETEGVRMPWLPVAAAMLVFIACFGLYRWYQQTYAFTVGLDYFEPEFQTYWMRLLWGQGISLVLLGGSGMAWAWFSRERDLSQLAPADELWRYYLVISILALGSIMVLFTLGVFAESDAAWHQITIRDTDFTPTHIGLQYFAIPAFGASLLVAFIWIHTRLPAFRHRVSVPAALITMGPILMMPNIGFNEWGHAFFYSEELFAAPIHWGFLVLGWSAFGLGGLVLQCLERMRELTTLPDDRVLDPVCGAHRR